MSGSEFVTFDPEIEEILRKVASDPDSALLRVPRPQRIRGLFERTEPASAWSSSWSRQERQLLQVYRAEVAALLRDACRIKLFDPSRSPWHASPYKTPQQDRSNAAELARTVASVQGDAPAGEDLSTARALIEKCVAEPRGAEPTVAELAEASLRLEPRDESRVMAALDYIQREMPRTAIRILGRVIAELPRPDVLATAWNNLGMARSLMKDLARAHQAHVEACNLVTDRADSLMNRLMLGIQLGLTEDVHCAAKDLDDLVSENHPLIGWYCAEMSEQRRKGIWLPSEESLQIRSKSPISSGSASRRIADVFA